MVGLVGVAGLSAGTSTAAPTTSPCGHGLRLRGGHRDLRRSLI
jgi:hypothetical protein